MEKFLRYDIADDGIDDNDGVDIPWNRVFF